MFVKNLVQRYNSFYRKYIVQQRREHEYAINRYYAHLIDPFFTKLAYDLKMTPNMVTVLACILGLSAAGAFVFEYWIAGAVLLQLHHYFDGVDGNLARLTNRCTPLGAKLDKISDQIVRLVLFVTIAVIVDVPLWARLAFVFTIYFDIFIVHYYVLPFMRRHNIIRAKWKQWFLDRGIIPAFDAFTVFFLISVFAVFQRLDILVYVVIAGKNLDWIYRVWECLRTKMLDGRV